VFYIGFADGYIKQTKKDFFRGEYKAPEEITGGSYI